MHEPGPSWGSSSSIAGTTATNYQRVAALQGPEFSCRMSDSEARERRRNKILASRAERMAKITGSASGDSTESLPSQLPAKPGEPREPKEPAKPSMATHKARPVEAAATPKAVSEPSSKRTDAALPKTPVQAQAAIASQLGFGHILIIVLAGLAYLLSTCYCHSFLGACQVQRAASICNDLDTLQWPLLISIFLGVEVVEISVGRIPLAKASSTVLLKDLVLFAFIILAGSQFK